MKTIEERVSNLEQGQKLLLDNLEAVVMDIVSNNASDIVKQGVSDIVCAPFVWAGSLFTTSDEAETTETTEAPKAKKAKVKAEAPVEDVVAAPITV